MINLIIPYDKTSIIISFIILLKVIFIPEMSLSAIFILEPVPLMLWPACQYQESILMVDTRETMFLGVFLIVVIELGFNVQFNLKQHRIQVKKLNCGCHKLRCNQL